MAICEQSDNAIIVAVLAGSPVSRQGGSDTPIQIDIERIAAEAQVGDCVFSCTAGKSVRAEAAGEAVIASAAGEEITPGAAVKGIGPGAASQRVILDRAGDGDFGTIALIANSPAVTAQSASEVHIVAVRNQLGGAVIFGGGGRNPVFE